MLLQCSPLRLPTLCHGGVGLLDDDGVIIGCHKLAQPIFGPDEGQVDLDPYLVSVVPRRPTMYCRSPDAARLDYSCHPSGSSTADEAHQPGRLVPVHHEQKRKALSSLLNNSTKPGRTPHVFLSRCKQLVMPAVLL
jgi:hypothetical protein